MFIVKRRSEIAKFAFFLVLMGLMAYYVAGKAAQWRAARGESLGALPAVTEPEPELQPSQSDGRDYFALFRMDRERRRGALRETLQQVMASESADTETRRKASQQLLEEGNLANLESRAELLVKAKGFEDVTVDLGDGTARVVIRAPALSEPQFVQVVDMVNRITGVKPGAIQVIARER